jgi:hypothetical protein
MDVFKKLSDKTNSIAETYELIERELLLTPPRVIKFILIFTVNFASDSSEEAANLVTSALTMF